MKNNTKNVVIGVLILVIAVMGYRMTLSPKAVNPELLDATDIYTTTYAPKSIPAIPSQKNAVKHSDEPTSSDIAIDNSEVSPAPIKVTPNKTSEKKCTSNDLEGNTYVQSNGPSSVGTILFKTRPGVSCILTGFPKVQIQDGVGILNTTIKTAGNLNTVAFATGNDAYTRVIWSNWCGRPIEGPISYKIQLSSDTGYLLIPAILQNGLALMSSPSCVSPQVPSEIAVASFVSSAR